METNFMFFPFKGKGAARIHLRDLARRSQEIEQRMRQLTKEFKEAFRAPRVTHLALHYHGGYFLLRWRASTYFGEGQKYFELCDSDTGRSLLQSLPESTRTVLLQYERLRLDLNLVSSLCHHELRRVREYGLKLEALSTHEIES